MNITEQVQKSTGNNIVIGFFPPIVSVTASPQILKTVQISRMLRTWLNYAKFAIICVVSWLQIPCILTMNSWSYVLLYLSQQNILVLLNVCIHVYINCNQHYLPVFQKWYKNNFAYNVTPFFYHWIKISARLLKHLTSIH